MLALKENDHTIHLHCTYFVVFKVDKMSLKFDQKVQRVHDLIRTALLLYTTRVSPRFFLIQMTGIPQVTDNAPPPACEDLQTQASERKRLCPCQNAAAESGL